MISEFANNIGIRVKIGHKNFAKDFRTYPITDHGRATHLELLGNVPFRDALGVERPDCIVACEPARPPFLAGDLICRRAAERARLDGQQECSWRLACGQHSRQALMEPIEQSFESFPQVADEMPPIEDLLGLWGAKGGPTRILCRAVTAHDEDAWMRLEPRSKRIADFPHIPLIIGAFS